MFFIAVFILGYIVSIISGALIAIVARPNETVLKLVNGRMEETLSIRSKLGGFLGGLLNPFLTCYIVFFSIKIVSDTHKKEFISIFISLLPLMIMGFRAIYVSGYQDGSKTKIAGSLNVIMIVNKWLWFGTFIGCALAFLYFSSK